MLDFRTVNSREFRSASGLFPTGVTIVTRSSGSGEPYGMTVSSFTSVSLEPPLILVCIDRRAGFMAGIRNDVRFAVNVLNEDQQQLAVRFSKQPEAGRFENVWFEYKEQTPVLAEAVAIFDCSVKDVIAAGDHDVVIGLVHGIARNPGRALVWCESSYHSLPSNVNPAAQP